MEDTTTTCRICKNATANNHNHYGSNSVCHSCRAFFMRSVKSLKYKAFKHNAECVIDSKTRKSCKRCRFDACLQAGMRVTFVHYHSGSIAREKIMKNQLQIEEEQYLENLYDTASDNTTQWTYDLYVQNIQLICPQVINSNYVHTSKDLDLIYRLNKFVHKQMAQDLGKKICTEDISVLFEHNYGRFRAFQMAMWFNDDMFKSEFAKKLVNHATMKKESVTSDSENTLIQLAKNGSMISSSYESFFDSPWANSAQVEIEHWKLHQSMYKWINTTRKSSFQNDKCTIILMNLILLHNTDGLQLNDSALVEKAQQRFINFLHKYLKSHLPETTAYSQLHKALMLVHDTQRIHELSQQRLKL